MAKTSSKEDCIDIYNEVCVGFDFPNVDEVDYSCSSFFVGETCTPTPELSNAPDDDNWLYIDGITDDGNLPGSGATNVTCGAGTVYNPATNSCVPYIPDEVDIDFSGTEKIDPEEELKCFDLNSSAKLTIYVQQPRENTSDVMGQTQLDMLLLGLSKMGL